MRIRSNNNKKKSNRNIRSNSNKNKNRERIELTKRDKISLEILWSYRALTVDSIRIMGGYSSNDYCLKRLTKMEKYGFVKADFIPTNSKKVFRIASKGCDLIGQPAKLVNINSQTEHEIAIGIISCYFQKKTASDVLELKTERNLLSEGKSYRESYPDLLNTAYNFLVEHERTKKSNVLLDKKIANLALHYSSLKQYFVIEKGHFKLEEKLIELLTLYNIDYDILYLQDIEEVIINA